MATQAHRVRVIVPSRYDDLLQEFLRSLEECQPGSSSVVYVADNGISEGLQEKWPDVLFVPVDRDPFVYAKAINRCVRLTWPHDTLVLGDDMIMQTPGWLIAVERVFAAWPEGYGTINLRSDKERPLGPLDVQESLTAQGGGITLTPRAVWDRIGPWDERYDGGYGYEDMDYCVQLWHAGLKVGTTGAASLKHAGAATWQRVLGSYGAVIRRCLVNYDLFYAKWGIPSSVNREIKFIEAAPHLARTCGCRGVTP